MQMKHLSVLALVLLMGAGCLSNNTTSTAPSRTVTVGTTATTIVDVKDLTWESYTDSDEAFDIKFDFPDGYAVGSGSNDSFTGYDIADASGKTKIKIVITSNGQAAESFRLALPGGDLGAAETASVTVKANPLYEPSGKVHVMGFGGLDSNPLSIYLIDEQPTSDTSFLLRVYESLQVVAK